MCFDSNYEQQCKNSAINCRELRAGLNIAGFKGTKKKFTSYLRIRALLMAHCYSEMLSILE
jgi:hypothetical protein